MRQPPQAARANAAHDSHHAGIGEDFTMLSRIGAAVTGFALFVYGMIAAFTPLPGGAPLVIIGVLLIAAAVPATRPLLRAMRQRWTWFDKLVLVFAKFGPESVIAVAEATAPAGAGRPKVEETSAAPEDLPNGSATGPATGPAKKDVSAGGQNHEAMNDKGDR